MSYEVNPILYSKKIEFRSTPADKLIRYGVHIRFKNVGQKLWFPADLRNQLLFLREGSAILEIDGVKSRQPQVCFRGIFDKPVEVSFDEEIIDVVAFDFFPEALHLLTKEKAARFRNTFTAVTSKDLLQIPKIRDIRLLTSEVEKWIISKNVVVDDTSTREIRQAIINAQKANGKISVDLLSERTGIHPRTLRRHFLKFVGLSPRSYLLQLKFEETLRRAVLDTGLKKLYLAESAAFYDQPHFINCFKRFAGVTPSRIENLDKSWLEFILNFES